MKPDESLFKQHLKEALFLSGVEESLWGLEGEEKDINWPYAILWCRATPRGSGYNKYYFRFNLDGYSESAPTAIPWDISKNQPLTAETWPAWSEPLQKVFNPKWNNGASLYAPCDRIAMINHGQWPANHPADYWTPKSTIVKYLEFLVKILNDATD